jgi:hypothetical protein
MLARAEHLKVLLAHRQAHHLSLLASILQVLHKQEVQQYDHPSSSRSCSPSSCGTHMLTQQGQQQQQQEALLQENLCAMQLGGTGGSDDDNDDFFLPVS